MLRWFSYEELAELDTPTAEADVVLDSFGGAPDIQDRTKPKEKEKEHVSGESVDEVPDVRRRQLKHKERDNQFTFE